MSDEDQTPSYPSVMPSAGKVPADIERALRMGRQGAVDDPAIDEMRLNRKVNSKKEGVGSIQFATGRPNDPMFYWKQNNIPFDIYKEDQKGRYPELEKLREMARALYLTHPVYASAVDIFSKYPLTGFELVSKDSALTDFYSEHFIDDLEYEEYLPEVGREYWNVGEAWPFAQFNEMLGVWESDELLNPDDIFVVQSPFSKDPRYEMVLPESLRKIIDERDPPEDFNRLKENYPELVTMGEDDRLVLSNVLLQHLRFKAASFHPRGIPIIMRGMRAIIQEEMLNAAQDAVASRLYTPLILATLGASASDLGTDAPWIPNEGDISAFQDAVDIALAADFRMLTYHFGVQMTSVFGRENMPRMEGDFDRLTERILQVFGLSKTMLSGASGGQTYAADALNRDLITQLLTTFQTMMKKFVRKRMLVVAEAQQHYDYEMRGGKRYPIMEEVLVVDPDGTRRIEEQPKLLVPDVQIRTMNMRDEQQWRTFMENMRESGVPISMGTRMVNVPIDLEEERERVIDEQVENAVAAEHARRATYQRLHAENLPIPEDLMKDFGPKATAGQEGDGTSTEVPTAQPGDGQQPLPGVGVQEPAEDTALVPNREELSGEEAQQGSGESAQVVPLPRNRQRPPESDEQRKDMPKPASLEVAAALTGKDAPAHVGERARITRDTDLDEFEREQRREA